MVYSRCLTCGSAIISGLYCKDCEWEIKRMRLGNEENFEIWLSSKTGSEKIKFERNSGLSLESFQ